MSFSVGRRLRIAGASMALALSAGMSGVVAPAQASSQGQVCSIAIPGVATTYFTGGGHNTTIDATGWARCLGGPSGPIHIYTSVTYASSCLGGTQLGLVHIWMPNGDFIIVGLTVIGTTATGYGKVESGPHKGQGAAVYTQSSRDLAACPNGYFVMYGMVQS
jgi:hypothetical protein